jgi:sortase B
MIRKGRILLAVCLLAVFLALGGYAAYQLFLSYDAYAQGDRAYETIKQQVISEDVSPSTEQDELIDIPDREVDFAALCAINPNAVAWLYCPDTVIDYPVIAADDYTYYLRHLPDGTYNINGSLFLDYECARDFSDRLSVIYGHNMKTEKMFGTLMGYKDQSYFDQHPYLYLYTQTHNYRIALLYGAVVSSTRWINEGYAQNPDGLLEYANAHTTFSSPVEYNAGQRLIVLSTCSYEFDGARYFVVGVLQ